MRISVSVILPAFFALDAMNAPALPYGIKGSMEAYPGALRTTESASSTMSSASGTWRGCEEG
jgi:hypothetical protein